MQSASCGRVWFAVTLVASVISVSGCGGLAIETPAPNMERVKELRVALEGEGGGSSSSSGQAAQQAEPTGFATLRGKILISGQAPPKVPLTIDKEVDICAPGGQTVYSQQLEVDDASGGIANVVLFADGIPAAWCHESAAPGKTGEIDFDQVQCMFTTHVSAMQTSQTLKILNNDRTGHNTNMKPNANPPLNATIAQRGMALYSPGTQERAPFEVNCSIHPWMSAWMLFRDDGYFAITQPDGTFEIANLPAGVPLEIKVWQEKVKFLGDVLLDDGSGEKATSLKKGVYAVTLQPDEMKEITIKVPDSVFR